jgi:hypothetical protein
MMNESLRDDRTQLTQSWSYDNHLSEKQNESKVYSALLSLDDSDISDDMESQTANREENFNVCERSTESSTGDVFSGNRSIMDKDSQNDFESPPTAFEASNREQPPTNSPKSPRALSNHSFPARPSFRPPSSTQSNLASSPFTFGTATKKRSDLWSNHTFGNATEQPQDSSSNSTTHSKSPPATPPTTMSSVLCGCPKTSSRSTKKSSRVCSESGLLMEVSFMLKGTFRRTDSSK